MNYGFAGAAYFGIFLSWFTFMYCASLAMDKGLGRTEEDESCKVLRGLAVFFAILVGLSLIVGVVQVTIETI